MRRLARSDHLCVSHVKGSDLAPLSHRRRGPSDGQFHRFPGGLVIDFTVFLSVGLYPLEFEW